MATTARTSKMNTGKKPQDSGQNSYSTSQRRPPAWNNANRNSISPIPPFSPNANNTRTPNGFSPPLQTNGKAGAGALSEEKEKLIASLMGSIGSTIVVTLRSTNIRYEGVLQNVTGTPPEGAGLNLKDAKDLSSPGAPLKDNIMIHAANIASFQASSAPDNSSKNGSDSFRTDSEISRTSQQKRERELQAWQPDGSDSVSNNPNVNVQRGDDITFGPVVGGSWDQFATNEKLFGVTTKFDEEMYTTKLDRSARDYKEKEKRAERIAAEITGSATTNPHVAEERNIRTDDSGANEEDKYGAVVRSANAYVPPGARRANSNNQAAAKEKPDEKIDIPSVSVNTPESEDLVPEKPSSPPAGSNGVGVNAKPPADAFRDFVTNEKQRLTQKRQAIVKSEMDKRMAELLKFSQNFKLNKPIPEDLVSILAKDEDRQKQIREKSEKDAASVQARIISASIPHANQMSPKVALVTQAAGKPVDLYRKPTIAAPSTAKSSVPTSKSSGAVSETSNNASANTSGKLQASATMPRLSMVIQPIPPFKGSKAKQIAPSESKSQNSITDLSTQPLSPTSAQKLNVNATSFRPNPKAVAFTPNGTSSSSASPSTTASPKVKSDGPSSANLQPNPFFGTQHIRKTPVNVKDDFNPFKRSQVAEASAVAALWSYTGKRYMQMFPPVVPPPQASPHMASHVPAPPPPPPPPPYDEATEAAARGYAVYTYAPYPYPGQPMMAGMGGIPPGFVPTPYMQHMAYQPNMQPPNGQPMYAPPMGQMHPPHQPYMAPPGPPGAYQPPPNASAPRPSMPPTPIPSHTHPYYQSPPMQHAVPYQMMIPPPAPTGPAHPYENAPPPVQMGGHA